MAKLKVWGIGIYLGKGYYRCIIAAPNQKEAAQAFNITINYLREYGGITGNDKELQIALSNPGIVFAALDGFRDYRELSEIRKEKRGGVKGVGGRKGEI